MISHIGSTAIPSIWAKPIIDILLKIPNEGNLLKYKDLIINNGYICMSQSENGLSFDKGYTYNGFAERVFHLHLRYAGDNNEWALYHPPVEIDWEHTGFFSYTRSDFDTDTQKVFDSMI